MRLSGTKANSIHQYRGFGNELYDFAGSYPNLDLPFAANKSLTDAVTGQNLVTFTRASSGTYVGSDGVLQTAANDVPRFDHNPTTGESLGLLVEESRTNLLLRSEEFDNATWVKPQLDTITANSIASPSGATTADSFVENTASGATHTLYQDATIVANSTNSISCFFKSAGRTQVLIKLSSTDDANGCNATFDLSAGTVSAPVNYGTGSGATASIQPFPSGWYRCVVNGNIGTALTTARIRIRPLSAGNEIYTGNGTTAFYIWGAQLEAGAFPTSYIPTTTATATRSADVASITGTNFSSWHNQSEGTVFADVNSAPVNNIAQLTFDISEGAGNERMFQRRNASGIVATAVLDNGVTQGDIGSVVIGASARYRSGFAYKLNDLEIVVNGGGSATDTSATIPTPDRLHIGQNYASGQICNGTLRRLTFWPSRLPGSTLQQITQ